MGCIVNVVIKINNSKDLVACLKFFLEEIGDGIVYKENLKSVFIFVVLKVKFSKGGVKVFDVLEVVVVFGKKIGSVDDVIIYIN